MSDYPPFISERQGETHINACTFCSGLMAHSSWTSNEVFRGMSAAAIHALRETLEPGPSSQARGFDPIDVDNAIQKHWPDTYPHIPSWDSPHEPLRIKWPEYQRRVITGECGILQGNVRKVKDPNSPLHRFVGDVGHAIYVHGGGPNAGYILDPMGLPTDSYNGSFVPWKDLEEFASEFSGAGYVFCSLVVKGAQSVANLNAQIAELTKERDTAQQRVRQLLSDVDKANIARDAAAAAELAAQKATVAANDALGKANITLANVTGERNTLQEQWSADEKLLSDCHTQLETADATISAEVGKALADAQTIADLTKQLDDMTAERDAILAQAEKNPAGLRAFARVWRALRTILHI